MRKCLIAFILVVLTIVPVYAMEFTPPDAPNSAEPFMPAEVPSFSEGLLFVFKESIKLIRPEAAEAAQLCLTAVSVVMLASMVRLLHEGTQPIVELVSVITIAAVLISPSNALISLGLETVREISEYGKLLLPVMTAAMAAQGGITASAALYTGSAFFNAMLTSAVSKLVGPMLCLYLCLCIVTCAVGEEMLENLKKLIKWLMTWSLKLVLYIFTGYMGITGVVSGSVDAAALKAAKLTISGVVPVVGGIISDASEAILVGAGVMKSTTGVYGLVALIATCVGPFIRIGVQYLLLKITASVGSVFGIKKPVEMIRSFSVAMGLLLAMTGTVCLLWMISTVCFMKELT